MSLPFQIKFHLKGRGNGLPCWETSPPSRTCTHTRTHTPLNPPTCTVLPKEIRLPNQVSSVCRLYILRGEMGYQAAPISPLLLEDKGSNILFIFTNILFLFSVLFQLFHNLKKNRKTFSHGRRPSVMYIQCVVITSQWWRVMRKTLKAGWGWVA